MQNAIYSFFTSYHNDKCGKKIYYYDELSSQGYSILLFCEREKKIDILCFVVNRNIFFQILHAYIFIQS